MILLLAVVWAQEPEVSGFVEARAGGQFGVDGVPWQTVQRVRPTLGVPLGKHLYWTTTAELFLSQGRRTQTELQRTLEASELGPLVEGICTWPTADNEVLGVDGVPDYLRLDRLYLDVYTRRVDLRVGRQALQWGSGLLINPTDPLPQVLFTEPWRPRAGVNSVRAIVPLGENHEVQAVLATDDRFQNVRAAARGTLNVKGFDLSLVGAYRQDSDDGIVGLDIRGTAGVGLWFEGAMHLGQGGYGRGVYEEIVVGLDYSVPVLNSLVFAAQYIRIGRESDEAAVAANLAGQVELPDCAGLDVAEALGADVEPVPFQPALSGNHYAMVVARLGFVRELSLDTVMLHNLGDGTGVVVPTLSVRPTGWLDVALSAQIPYRMWGDGGEFKPRADALTVDAPLGLGSVQLDGLVPEAQLTGWVRANF